MRTDPTDPWSDGTIHQSHLNSAFRCGESFRRRYVLGEKIPPTIPAARGTGVHGANEVNLRQKIESHKDLSVSDMQDAARDTYVRVLKDGIFLSKSKISEKRRLVNDGLNDTIALTRLYAEEVAPKIEPLATERKFTIRLPEIPIPLSGTIDIQQDGRIDDLKTSGKKWPDGQIRKEIQPVMYSLAVEHETGKRSTFYYHVLRNLKKGPKRQVQSMTATEGDYGILIRRIQVFLKMLEAGVFPPASPAEYFCSEDWCGYYTSCVYQNNGPILRWI